LLNKATLETAVGLKAVVIEVASEAVKKVIWPQNP